MDDDMIYYAKSPNSQGYQQTVKEHLLAVAEFAQRFGATIGLDATAELAGQTHDFGKYSQAFQEVLSGTRIGIDHAMGGACYLEAVYRGSVGARPVIEAVNGHHNGLVAYDEIRSELHAVADPRKRPCGNGGKTPAIEDKEQLQAANAAFRKDFPSFKPPMLSAPPIAELESMLYTRMLFSCLVDADYTASALNDDSTYLDRAENNSFDPQALLKKLTEYRDGIRQSSTADRILNTYRDRVFEQCGKMGDEPEGLYTLTAPTGTGKTLALLHFALRHCLKHGKQRIIMVLPFLTLAEQSAEVYSKIIPDVLIDHSQSDLPEDAWELAARWSAPIIITTSVRFFESLFSDRPAACRKLHNIANSVVLFDEAQSLPADLTSVTLQAVNELCSRYHTTMVFSTATQPDFSARKDLTWKPREILPESGEMFRALQRVKVEWRLGEDTPLETIAEEMSGQDSVCAIVNLRRHARQIVGRLSELCPKDTVFYLTTDLCPAHRSKQIKRIRERLKNSLPCRVVATQCIEAGVDLDFRTMYRALAPLDAIIQAAGRCNRNGGAMGRVTVFCPADPRMPYPDQWYSNAAVTVREMGPPFSIHDPENVREYYRRLFHGKKDKQKLRAAIDSRSFAQTAAEYRLIDNAGAQVIVPYSGADVSYTSIAKRMRDEGVTHALLKEFLWRVHRIEVLEPIRYISFKRNEIKCTVSSTPVSAEEERTQRQTTALQDVRYRIAASIEPRPAFAGRETQLYEQALRRIRGGKCYFQPSLGLREFTCYFEESDGTRPPIQESLDAGLMVYDLFTPEDVEVTKKTKIQMSLFHAVMENGVISVPPYESPEVLKGGVIHAEGAV